MKSTTVAIRCISSSPAENTWTATSTRMNFSKAEQKNEEKAKRKKNFPESPERDVLKFLLEYAPLNSWQKRVLGIVRDESYYFAPQGQTKILNEGWATYWHSRMMTELHPLQDSEISTTAISIRVWWQRLLVSSILINSASNSSVISKDVGTRVSSGLTT